MVDESKPRRGFTAKEFKLYLLAMVPIGIPIVMFNVWFGLVWAALFLTLAVTGRVVYVNRMRKEELE